MKTVLFFNSAGRAISYMRCADNFDSSELADVPGMKAVEIEGEPRHLECYYIDATGVLRTREPPPTDLHKWGESGWEIDSDLLMRLEAAAAASKRAQLLSECDWTQLPDVPLTTREVWATYRQALRDITDQPGYPLEINWPTPPN